VRFWQPSFLFRELHPRSSLCSTPWRPASVDATSAKRLNAHLLLPALLASNVCKTSWQLMLVTEERGDPDSRCVLYDTRRTGQQASQDTAKREVTRIKSGAASEAPVAQHDASGFTRRISWIVGWLVDSANLAQCGIQLETLAAFFPVEGSESSRLLC